MKRVFIIEWEYESGGGFQWYHNKSDMEKNLKYDMEFDILYKDYNWKTFNFTLDIPENIEDITKYIEYTIY